MLTLWPTIHPHDKYLIFPKVLYFALNLMCYSTYTYTAQYFFTKWLITNEEFGYIVGFSAISFTGSILWTHCADRTGRFRHILILASIGYALSFFALCIPFLMNCNVQEWSSITRFTIAALASVVSNFFTSALYPLIDRRIFQILQSDSRFDIDLFGRQRLFGIFGQCFMTTLNGFLITKFGIDVLFISLVASTVIFVALLLFVFPTDSALVPIDKEHADLSNYSSSKASVNSTAKAKSESSSLYWKVLTPRFSCFLLLVFLASMTRGVVGNFLPPYFELSVKFSSAQTGLLLQSRIITEVGFFFLGRHLMSSFGPQWVFFIAELTGALRVLAYAAIPLSKEDSTSTWIRYSPLIVELLKGINNACLIASGVRIAHDHSDEDCKAIAQGYFSGIHAYLSNAASGFFGGLVLKYFHNWFNPYRTLFAFTFVLSCCGIFIHLFIVFFQLSRPS